MDNSAVHILTDEQLVKMAQEGSETAEEILIEKYKSLAKGKAKIYFIVGAEAEDVVQEGMIGLIKAVRNFDSGMGRSFAGFAETCVLRQMYTAIEASNRKKHMPLNSYISLYEESETNKNGTKLPLIDLIEPDRENDPEALYFGREYTEAFIERLKENLSPMEEQVLYLHLTGTDYKKIAELLKKSPKSIDNALQRIKKKTEKMLKTEIRA